MGRGTQLYDYLTAEVHPTALQIRHKYTSLTITDELKKFRRKWRKERRRKMKKIYRFCWDVGRMGTVEGIFIADSNEVEKQIGKEVYFGEILGKHSEICGTLDNEDLEIKSDDPAFVEKCIEVFGDGTISGYNPLDYIYDD